MSSIIRITVLSLLFTMFYHLEGFSSNRNNLADVAHEGSNIRRPNLLLKSSDVYSSVPTGSVISFAGDKAPQGWLFCDGQNYSDADYPELYRVIGTTYLPKESHFHTVNQVARREKFFCVPDLRGRTLVGVDSNASRVTANNTLGASSGEEKHQLTIAEMPSHDHQLSYLDLNCLSVGPGGGKCALLNQNAMHSTTHAGNNQLHNNMQPYLVLNYIIKTGQEESDNQHHQTAQRAIELDSQRTKIAQLEQELNNLKIVSAKAWIVFDGTSTTILNSYGVSSVVKNSTGNYTISFIKPFSSKDYCFALNAGSRTVNGFFAFGPINQSTKTNFRFMTCDFAGALYDVPVISACFYGDQ